MPSLPRSHNIVGRWVPSAGATGFSLVDRVRSNHGTLTNMDAASDWVASGGKLALDFDGSNDFVSFADVSLGTIHTCSAWVKPNGQVGAFNFGGILGDGSTNTGPLGITGASSTQIIYSAGVSGVVATVSSMLGSWHSIVSVRVGLAVVIYQNGVEVASGNLPVNDASTVNRIGHRNGANNLYFNGQIDDVTIYNTALTANEVREIYRLGRGYGVFPEPDFDEGFAAAGFKAYWARRQSQLIGGGV